MSLSMDLYQIAKEKNRINKKILERKYQEKIKSNIEIKYLTECLKEALAGKTYILIDCERSIPKRLLQEGFWISIANDAETKMHFSPEP